MSNKRLLLVGGGSGGHVTPLLAIAKRIKKEADYDMRLWCDKKVYQAARNLFEQCDDIRVEKIMAGKMRRYHHLKWWQHLMWSIFWPNLKDFFRFVGGLVQSLAKLIVWRPDLIFAKGGYVCLPVGLAARVLRIKVIIHDSDTLPGLTNRILSKSAARIATGFPVEYYSYPKDKTVFTGIPIQSDYRPISSAQQADLKQSLGFSSDRPLVLVSGGGLGARCLNRAIIVGQHQLSSSFSVVLASGEAEYEEVVKQISAPLVVKAFITDIHQYVLASDLVICRAGATTLAELAASRKLALVVPSIKLAGGHQIKNADTLKKAGVAIVLDEETVVNQPEELTKKVIQILSDDDLASRKKMLDNFHRLANPDATGAVVDLIMSEAEK